MALVIEAAVPEDLGAITALLAEADLPGDDVADHLQHFLVARYEDEIVGTVGLEFMPPIGFLRSLAVLASQHGRGFGGALCRLLLARARQSGLGEMYLMTTTAEDYFSTRGWSRIEREQAPQAVRDTRQFQGLCPASATCMRLLL